MKSWWWFQAVWQHIQIHFRFRSSFPTLGFQIKLVLKKHFWHHHDVGQVPTKNYISNAIDELRTQMFTKIHPTSTTLHHTHHQHVGSEETPCSANNLPCFWLPGLCEIRSTVPPQKNEPIPNACYKQIIYHQKKCQHHQLNVTKTQPQFFWLQISTPILDPWIPIDSQTPRDICQREKNHRNEHPLNTPLNCRISTHQPQDRRHDAAWLGQSTC